MIDPDELERLAGLVADYPIEGSAKRNALISLGRYTAKHLPTIIAALETARLVRAEIRAYRATIAALTKETDNAHD